MTVESMRYEGDYDLIGCIGSIILLGMIVMGTILAMDWLFGVLAHNSWLW